MQPRNLEEFITAANNGELEIVQAYLKANEHNLANVNAKNLQKTTALIGAAKFGYDLVVAALAAFPGILINIKDEAGKTALHYAEAKYKESYQKSKESSPYQKALVQRYANIIKTLKEFKYDVAYCITNMGADCRLPQEEVNAILTAAYQNVKSPEVGKKALDEAKLTPLMKAVKLYNYFAAWWLLENKKSKVDIDYVNLEKNTALTLAVSYRDANKEIQGEEAHKIQAQRNIIDLLMKHKASLYATEGMHPVIRSYHAELCATGYGNLYFLSKYYDPKKYFEDFIRLLSGASYDSCLRIICELYLNIVTGGQLILEYWEDTILINGGYISQFDYANVLVGALKTGDIELIDSIWKKLFLKLNLAFFRAEVVSHVLKSLEKDTIHWLSKNIPDCITELLKQAEKLQWHRESKPDTVKLLKSLFEILPSENCSDAVIESIRKIFVSAAEHNSLEIVKIILLRFSVEGANYSLPANTDPRIKNYFAAVNNVRPENEDSLQTLPSAPGSVSNETIDEEGTTCSMSSEIKADGSSDIHAQKTRYVLFNNNNMVQAKIRELQGSLTLALSSLNAIANKCPEHREEIENIIKKTLAENYQPDQAASAEGVNFSGSELTIGKSAATRPSQF